VHVERCFKAFEKVHQRAAENPVDENNDQRAGVHISGGQKGTVDPGQKLQITLFGHIIQHPCDSIESSLMTGLVEED